jgi:hypothetical protein
VTRGGYFVGLESPSSASSAFQLWRRDRQALLRYRLRAARYGLDIRRKRSLSDVLGVIGLLITLAGFVIAVLKSGSQIYGEIFGVLILLGIWPVVRYLGSLNAIMRSAASTEEGTRKVFNDMQKGMNNVEAYAALRDVYRPLITEANASLTGFPAALELVNATGSHQQGYAVAVVRTQGLASLSTIIGNLSTKTAAGKRSTQQAESRQQFVNRWRTIHKPPGEMSGEEGDNYCLTEMRFEDGRLVLDLGVATYGQISRTCEALVNEFALFSFIVSRGGLLSRMRSSTVLQCLPWRRQAHNAAGSSEQLFLKPRGRAAGIGVALATVTGMGQGHVHLGERSHTVGTYPNVLHLIPAGNCNTHGTDRRVTDAQQLTVPAWYLESIVKCEYLEEWFNNDDLEKLRIPDWRDRVDKLWTEHVHELSPIKLTGIAYDLLNLRPEICAMVRVRFTGTEILNWEYKMGMPPQELALADTGDIMPNKIVQSAAGALMLARSYRSPRRPGIKKATYPDA